MILNGVCVIWKGWIDLQRLDGMGCLEFDEERAQVWKASQMLVICALKIMVVVCYFSISSERKNHTILSERHKDGLEKNPWDEQVGLKMLIIYGQRFYTLIS